MNFYVGLLGAIILVVGAAYPLGKPGHPVKSVKNWLFLVGGLFMFAYALLNYLDGGSIFFVLLQFLINGASILMMFNLRDTIDVPIIAILGLFLVGYSLYLFDDYSTLPFIIGLTGLGIGYVLEMGTVKRNLALVLGSLFIVWFSYLVSDWIFFGLNVFFALFSGYYVVKLLRK